MADADPLRRLGVILAERGFTEAGRERAFAGLAPPAAETLRSVHPPGDEALAPLIELFDFGLPVSAERVSAALSPLPVSALEDEGLVRAHRGLLSTPLRVTPFAGLLLLHDPWGESPLTADHVGGPTEAAETLAHLTVRREVEDALDLGTGCGIQALHASSHARGVVATDVNPRAAAIARMNVRLNGVENVEVRTGDLFAPVRDERFDLVVANPPYVISPASDLLFRDSGLAPGELCQRIVGDAANHLRTGGFSCVLANWATGGGADRWDAPRSWSRESGCDVCAFAYGPEAVLPYAARWSEPPASADDTAHAETVARWLEFYEAEGIDTVWFGGLVLRRRDGPNWFRGIDLPDRGAGSGSDHILRIFEAIDFVEGPHELDAERFAPADGSRLAHVLEHREGRFELDHAVVTLAEGVGVRPSLDPLAVHVLVRLDGRRRLAELVEEVANERSLEHSILAERARDAVRTLYELGLLARVSP